MRQFYKCLVMAVCLLGMAGPGLADDSDKRAEALYHAVASGDTERVRDLIDGGTGVNRAQRPWELTPLLVAVGIDAELTDLLIRAEADVNAREREGVTVLMKAVHGGDAAVVRRLLKEPALDVDARGPRGNTALTYAVLYGYAGMVEALVERGANVDVVRADGTTPKGIARHMYALAEAMPEEEREDASSDGAHAHHGRGTHGVRHDPPHEGPHDHHRSRAEAVSSHGRVLGILAEAGASVEGVKDTPAESRGAGGHGHHHH